MQKAKKHSSIATREATAADLMMQHDLRIKRSEIEWTEMV